MAENSYFLESLNNLTKEFAYADSVRHLTDKGLTAPAIRKCLSYPAPFEEIQKIMWERLLQTHIIVLRSDSSREASTKDPEHCYEFIEEYDSWGRKSFRRIKKEPEPTKVSDENYYTVDFGKQLAENHDEFIARLNLLDSYDREYILYLPWPESHVYHAKDARMRRIYPVIYGKQHLEKPS